MIINKPRKLIKLEDEIWQYIPDCNNRYQISNYGRVKSFAFNKTEGVVLKSHVIKGFKTVHLRLNKEKRETFYLHKLVSEIWIPRPSMEYKYVGHKDGNMINNHISNLEWMTKELLNEHHQNLRAISSFGKPKRKNNNKVQINNTKLKENDIRLLKTMLQKGTPQNRIARMFCISEMQVTRIKRGENWSHVEI